MFVLIPGKVPGEARLKERGSHYYFFTTFFMRVSLSATCERRGKPRRGSQLTHPSAARGRERRTRHAKSPPTCSTNVKQQQQQQQRRR